ncbi:MAG: hypothetical protein KDA84_03875, partial [Planctomycetaceae bacterium]|nr:hypothetical protein [Planctomycetaceae bacterium]
LVDESDGNFEPGDFSLREAIEQANANPGLDEITFAPSLFGQTIQLNGTQLFATDHLSIVGSAANPVTIDAQNASRVLTIRDRDLTLEGLRLIRGNGLTGGKLESVDGYGGALLVDKTSGIVSLTMIDCEISDSHATQQGGGAFSDGVTLLRNSRFISNTALSHGGGFAADNVNVTALNTTFQKNDSRGFGGGLHSLTGTMTVRDSVFEGNSTHSGGGALDTPGNIVISSTLFTGNTSDSYGGAINASAALVITNSTLSGNTADRSGGAIYTVGSAKITNSTIVYNRANNDQISGPVGGGIATSNANVTLNNTIVAGNDLRTPPQALGILRSDIERFGSSGAAVDVANSHNNVIGNPQTSGGLTNGPNGNIVGVLANEVVLPLTDNGGQSPTHDLAENSPALDAGSNAFALDENSQPLTLDQRGSGFDRIVSGTVDVGAFEVQGPTADYVVDTLVDESDGDYSTGDLSLREAIELANANPGAEAIGFSLALLGKTITLNGNHLLVTDALSIVGSAESPVIIDANNASRVLTSHADLHLEGLNLMRGNGLANSSANSSTGFGGALNVTQQTGQIKFTMFDCNVSESNAPQKGGGIYTDAITEISRSSIEGNTAQGAGGGFAGAGGTLHLMDSAVASNKADHGGGLITFPGSTIERCQILDNHVVQSGGGIESGGSTYVIDSLLHESPSKPVGC